MIFIFLFLTHFTLYNRFLVPFNGRVISHRVYVPQLLYPSSVDGHLGCFHVLAIVNSGAMSNEIHVSFSVLVSSGYMPRRGLLGHMVVLFLVS